MVAANIANNAIENLFILPSKIINFSYCITTFICGSEHQFVFTSLLHMLRVEIADDMVIH